MITAVKTDWRQLEEFDREARTGLFTDCVIDNTIDAPEGCENTVAIVYGRNAQEVAESGRMIAQAPRMLEALEDIAGIAVRSEEDSEVTEITLAEAFAVIERMKRRAKEAIYNAKGGTA